MEKILIADAGSTKTSWSLSGQPEKQFCRITGAGVNPAHDSEDYLLENFSLVKEGLPPAKIDKIYFFGSGCATSSLKKKIRDSLANVFKTEEIIVESDLLGAAIALFGMDTGVAAILGTGSASCVCSEGKIINQVPSLGYLLGDEGGGVSLGKRLLNGIFKRTFSESLIENFQEEYNLSLPELINRVYGDKKAATFIGSFTPFLKKQIQNKEIKALIENEFISFFEKNIIPYGNSGNYNIGFVGSIAFNFKDVLIECAKKFNYKVTSIIQHPLPYLENFYIQK